MFYYFFSTSMKSLFCTNSRFNPKNALLLSKKGICTLTPLKIGMHFFFPKKFFVCSIGPLQTNKKKFQKNNYNFFSTTLKMQFVLIQDFYFEKYTDVVKKKRIFVL